MKILTTRMPAIQAHARRWLLESDRVAEENADPARRWTLLRRALVAVAKMQDTRRI